MTKEDFIKVYKEMIAVELEKSDCRQRDQQYHEIRYYAFRLADEIREIYDRRTLAESIIEGNLPKIENDDDLESYLEDLWSIWDDHTDVLQDLRNGIQEYFGTQEA